MQFLRHLFNSIFVILLVGLVGFIIFIGYVISQPLWHPFPSLIADLSGGAGSLDQKFTQRLAQRFPAGSKESDLIRELSSERFQLMTDMKPPQKRAIYDSINEKSGLLNFCRYQAQVIWSAENAGRITKISGIYFVTCL